MSERTFTIGLAPEARTVQTDEKGEAHVSYTVTNVKQTPVRGIVQVVAGNGAEDVKVTLEGPSQRDFKPTESFLYTLKFQMPPGAKDGIYNFHLEAADAANPSQNHTEGESVAVEHKVPVAVVDDKGGKVKWPLIIAIAAVVLLVIGVGLYFALKPKGVEVPNLIGTTVERADELLTEKKLEAGPTTRRYVEGKTIDTVVDQDPKPSDRLPEGGRVSLVLQDLKPIMIKDYVAAKAMSQAAVAELEAAGLKVLQSQERVGDAPPGTVVKQTPAAGPVKPGSEVALVIQAPPAAPVMPPVKGKTLQQAKDLLLPANIVMGPPNFTAAPGTPGTVVSSSIAEGQPVPIGTKVVLTVVGVKVPTMPANSTVGDASFALTNAKLQIGGVASRRQEISIGGRRTLIPVTARTPFVAFVPGSGTVVEPESKVVIYTYPPPVRFDSTMILLQNPEMLRSLRIAVPPPPGQ